MFYSIGVPVKRRARFTGWISELLCQPPHSDLLRTESTPRVPNEGAFAHFIRISPFNGISSREKPCKPVSVTKTNHPIPDGSLFGVGAATGGDRVSASGKDGRTPAMRRLFAKRAHCKWHNIAPPERRRIGSTCARVPKVSSRNRGCPFRGYGCGGNPQEGGATLPCQRTE